LKSTDEDEGHMLRKNKKKEWAQEAPAKKEIKSGKE